MNLEQFRSWAVGQGQVSNPVGRADWLYTGQCVSLVQQYLTRVYGIPFQARGHAKDWATNGNVLSYFDKVGDIRPGDIIVYPGGFGGGYGHIAIALGNGQMLDQNGDNKLRVAIRPVWGGYSAILRRKGATPSQGDNMITDGDRDPIRVISSEVKGWDFNAVHQGVWDAREVNAWKGRPWRDFIMQGWNEGAAFRNERERNRIFYQQYASVIADLPNRPTKAQLDEAMAKLADEAKKVEKANAEAEAARKALAETEAKKSEDTVLLDETGNWLGKLIKRIWR